MQRNSKLHLREKYVLSLFSCLLKFHGQREKPFARARDDEDLDAMYKARRRWGDPMGHLNKKSKSSQQQLNTEFTPVIDETNRHWFEKSGPHTLLLQFNLNFVLQAL